MRNPSWTRDELILGLDTYLQYGAKAMKSSNPIIVELSKFLNHAPFHQENKKSSVFRNPAGVALILCSFKEFDVATEKRPTHGSQKGMQIWIDFALRPEYLHRVATSLKMVAQTLNPTQYVGLPDTCTEGQTLNIYHLIQEEMEMHRYENINLASNRKVKCLSCGIEYMPEENVLQPHLSINYDQYPLTQGTSPSDFAWICNDCHEAIHTLSPLPQVVDSLFRWS